MMTSVAAELPLPAATPVPTLPPASGRATPQNPVQPAATPSGAPGTSTNGRVAMQVGRPQLQASVPRMQALVRSWTGQLAPRVAPAVQQPTAGFATPVPAALNRALPQLFPAGSRVLLLPGQPLPLVTGDAEPVLQTVRSALTESRLGALESLGNDGQRLLARSLVGAALGGLRDGSLSTGEFGDALDAILLEAQAWQAGAGQPATSPTQPQPQPQPQDRELPPAPTADLPLPPLPGAQPTAPGNLTFSFGEPATFPVDARPTPPTPGLIQQVRVGTDLALKVIGGRMDQLANRNIVEPMERYIRQPTVDAALDLYGRFSATPAGALFNGRVSDAHQVVQSVIGEGTPVGNALQLFDQKFVRNDALWKTIDQAGARMRQVGVGALATTMLAVGNAYRDGTLQTGTFNTSGQLSADQLDIARQINLPSNMNVRWYRAPWNTPVTTGGRTYNVKGHALIVVGEGDDVVLLPALGPGRPGAQPWFGQEGGAIVAASSSVAAKKWGVLGFNIGTDNFNIGGRADLQLGRGLLNILAAQHDRHPQPGVPANRLRTIIAADAVSTFHSMTLNTGPIALVFDRARDPQHDMFRFPAGRDTFSFGGSGRRSVVQPAAPLVGATTFDASKDDWQLLMKLLGGHDNPPPRR